MSVDGIWDMEIDSPRGKRHVRLVARAHGRALTGTMSNPEAGITAELTGGTVDGDELGWKVKLPGFLVTLTFRMTRSGDVMTGQVKAGLMGRFPASGRRRVQ